MQFLDKYLWLIIVLIGLVSLVPVGLALVLPGNVPVLKFTSQAAVEGMVFCQQAYVSGAVNSPGVYNIVDDMRIAELIDLAGGFVSDADVEYVNAQLNLAGIIVDEQHIYIPFASETNQVSEEAQMSRVNLNTATSGQLEEVPGIGPATAGEIIANRPYSKLEDLLNVSGIGPQKYDQIKTWVGL